MFRGIRRHFLVAAAIGFAAVPSCALADGATGQYVQYACHLPDGTPAPADGFAGTTMGYGEAANNCASGGGLELRVPTTDQAVSASARWSYTTPANLTQRGFAYTRVQRGFADNDGSSTRIYAGGADYCRANGPCPETMSYDLTLAPDNTANASDLSFLAMCNYGTPCHGPTGTTGDGFAAITAIAITLRDSSLPTLSSTPSGDLLTGGSIAGTRSLNFSAHDDGGGVRTAALVVDGVEKARQTVDSNDGKCAEPFVYAVPCKTEVTGSIALDTTTLSNGQHDVSLVVYDATNSNSIGFGPFPINVQNEAPPGGDATSGSSTPSRRPGDGPLGRILAKHALHQRFGHALVVMGLLVDAAGKPVAHAVISASEMPARGGTTPAQLGTATTDANGRFKLKLPSGPTRRIRLFASAQGSPSTTIRIVVPLPVSLQANKSHLHNGDTLVLTARTAKVAGSTTAARVGFQVLIGKTWRTFAVRSVNESGQAHVAHRFRVTYHRMSYQFRAVAHPVNGLPFAASHSRPAIVQVN